MGEFRGIQLTTDSHSLIDDFSTVHVSIDGANYLIESKLILKVLFVNYLKFVSMLTCFVLMPIRAAIQKIQRQVRALTHSNLKLFP